MIMEEVTRVTITIRAPPITNTRGDLYSLFERLLLSSLLLGSSRTIPIIFTVINQPMEWSIVFQLGLLSLMESMSLAFLKCSRASLISTVLAKRRPFGIFLSGHIPFSYMNSSLFSLRLVYIFMSFPMKPILLFITSTLNCPPGTGF